jgi:hypothetical protein
MGIVEEMSKTSSTNPFGLPRQAQCASSRFNYSLFIVATLLLIIPALKNIFLFDGALGLYNGVTWQPELAFPLPFRSQLALVSNQPFC